MTRFFLSALAALIVLSAGCPKKQIVKPPQSAQEAFETAQAALEAKRYKEAEETFTFVIFNFPGSRQAADAQFYLAETYFDRRDYTQAQTEYDFYLKSFPNGRFEEQASYKLGLAYLNSAPSGARDQSRIIKAKEMLEDFLIRFPESTLKAQVEESIADINRRLAARDFDVALLYYKAGEYRAALTYYEYLFDRLPEDQWPAIERLRLAVSYAETGALDKARPILESLAATSVDPLVKQQAQERLSRLK